MGVLVLSQLGITPGFLDVTKAPTSGPCDGAEDRPAEEQHRQDEQPSYTRLVGRDQDGGTETEDKDRKDSQADFGRDLGGSFPEVTPEARLVFYRIREHDITLSRLNIPLPIVALVLVWHIYCPDWFQPKSYYGFRRTSGPNH
ncbi:MAG: hypothetical protein ABSB86_15520 [Bryobacteraceae bacterium]